MGSVGSVNRSSGNQHSRASDSARARSSRFRTFDSGRCGGRSSRPLSCSRHPRDILERSDRGLRRRRTATAESTAIPPDNRFARTKLALRSRSAACSCSRSSRRRSRSCTAGHPKRSSRSNGTHFRWCMARRCPARPEDTARRSIDNSAPKGSKARLRRRPRVHTSPSANHRPPPLRQCHRHPGRPHQLRPHRRPMLRPSHPRSHRGRQQIRRPSPPCHFLPRFCPPSRELPHHSLIRPRHFPRRTHRSKAHRPWNRLETRRRKRNSTRPLPTPERGNATFWPPTQSLRRRAHGFHGDPLRA